MTEQAAHTAPETELLCALVYELLDANADTLEFAAVAADLCPDADLAAPADLTSDAHLTSEPHLAWQAHLNYLRALQRKAREILARTSTGAPHR